MNRIARGEHLTVPAEPLHAAVTWTAVPALPDAGAIAVAALLLDGHGTLRDDADLVSSHHAGHPSGAVHHLGTSEGEAGLRAEWLVFDPAQVEPDVTRVVVAAATKGRALGRVPGLGLAVTTATGAPVAHVPVEDGVRFEDGGDGGAGPGAEAGEVAAPTAAVLGEFRRQGDGGWQFGAVLRGYASGLGGVVEAHRAGTADEDGRRSGAEAHPAADLDAYPAAELGAASGADLGARTGPGAYGTADMGSGPDALGDSAAYAPESAYGTTDAPVPAAAPYRPEDAYEAEPAPDHARDRAPEPSRIPEIPAYPPAVPEGALGAAPAPSPAVGAGAFLPHDRATEVLTRIVPDAPAPVGEAPVVDAPPVDASRPDVLGTEPETEPGTEPGTEPEDAPPSPATASYGPDFAPWEQTGRGNREVVPDRPLPPGAALVEFTSPEGWASLEARDAERPHLLSATNGIRGRVVLASPPRRRPRLRVEARRDWTLKFLPLAEARVLEADGALQGTGSDVLRYTGPAADLRINHPDGRNAGDGVNLLAVYPGGDPADRDGADVLAQGYGALVEVVPVAGPCLLILDAGSPWSLTARTSAAPEPSDGVLAEYSGQGRNLDVVEITNPRPGSPVILEYDLEGSEYFAVTEADDYGGTRELISKDEGFEGRRLLFADGGATTRLELGALPRWRFRLRDLSAARPLSGAASDPAYDPASGTASGPASGPVTGTGCDVLVHTGPPAALTLELEDGGFAHVTSLSPGELARVRVARAHTSRPARGPLRARPGAPTYVLVTAAADQEWKLTLRPAEEIRAFDGTVTGHGHDVVRWDGPPGPVRFDYDFDDGGPLLDDVPRPELWALDEELSPLHRVAAGIGVHHVPTGFLQVRAWQKWRITSGT
ncbi:TerD family protein [Streptomyces sp. I05A-00742]|uniref:TerD family protein n=1 Tax=Streptomyces sp. I05A-00742 TaxID=2732853 RepID=UPI00148954BF|nr:TerD family protein [Streptomyces sp. I05A-00742]